MACIKIVTPKTDITMTWVQTRFFRKNKSMSKDLIKGTHYAVAATSDGYTLLDGPKITLDRALFISVSDMLDSVKGARDEN